MITGDRRSGANALRPFLSPHPGFPYYFFVTGGLSPAIALTPTLWTFDQGVCSLLLDGFFQELYTGFIVVAFCNVQRGFVLPYFLLFCSEFK